MMTADQYRQISELRQARRFLDLTQLDIYAETGILPSRLSAAESGRRPLSEAEFCLLQAFLKVRLLAIGEVHENGPMVQLRRLEA